MKTTDDLPRPLYRLYFFALDGVCDACEATKPLVRSFRSAHPEVEVIAYDLTEVEWPEEDALARFWKRLKGLPPLPEPPDTVPMLVLVERWGNEWRRPWVITGEPEGGLDTLEAWFVGYKTGLWPGRNDG